MTDDIEIIEHYKRGNKWFTNRGNVPFCNCGAEWICPYWYTAAKELGVDNLPMAVEVRTKNREDELEND